MSSFSWEYSYSYYQLYFLFHLQDFLDFYGIDSIHAYVQHVDLLNQGVTVLDVVQVFKTIYHLEY